MDLRTVVILTLIFVLALTLRSYYNWEPATKDDYKLTGGSDPYYHKRVSDYVVDNGVHLKKDPLLNYPIGGSNNRPPVFDWSLAVTGVALSPFNGHDVDDTTWKAFLVMPAVWGALTILPVFFLAQAQFGRKAGLWSSFLFAIMSGHISHSTLALADHDAYFMFFTATAFYFFMRALMVAREGKWVVNWADPDSIGTGFREYVSHNQMSLGYAAMAGMSITAVALAWKGFPYLLVIIFGYTVIQLLVNMFQGRDSLAVAVVVAITMGLPMLLSLPYYHSMNFIATWWMAPFYIFAGTMVVAAILVPTRDLPWSFVLTCTTAVAGLSYALLKYIFKDQGELLFSGQGYFTRTKLFNTIAEAQPPDFSTFVFAYGIATTWLALVGAAYMVYLIYARRQWKADYLFVLVWAVTSIYMARSAVRFIYNATPVFALLAGWVVFLLLQWADFPTWWQDVRRSSGGGYRTGQLRYSLRDRLGGISKATGVKHGAVAFLVVILVVLANGLQGLDAGVPYENKKEVDVWIWDHLPGEGLLKQEEYNSSQSNNLSVYPEGTSTMYNRTNSDLRYIGVTGPNFPSAYWIEGLEWLATQDTQLPEEQRPAFISWWDYGFWAIDIGEHPTVADNFQWGYQLAGNFIAAQSQKESIALMVHRLVEPQRVKKEDPNSDQVRSFFTQQANHRPVRETLLEYLSEEQVAKIERILSFPEDYIPVKANGELEDVHKKNAAIRSVRPILMGLSEDKLADLLFELETLTGKSIRYFAVDQRLMPFSAQNTGIFYAPITLADYDIQDFIEVRFITAEGEELTADQASQRAQDDPQFKIADQKLVYKERFLDSMFYRAFVGWSGLDIGGTADNGIPQLSGDLSNMPILPAWNLSHYKLVKAIPGLSTIKYYDGARLHGQVTTPNGRGVPNVRVTLLDVDSGVSIPHDTTMTDEFGYYELTAVAGNLTLSVSQGPLASQNEMLQLTSNNILSGAQDNDIFVSEAQAYRQGAWEIEHNVVVKPASLSGRIYIDVDGNGDYAEHDDLAMAGKPVILKSNFSGRQIEVTTDEEGLYAFDEVPPGEYNLTTLVQGHTVELGSYLGEAALRTDQELEVDGAINPARITGSILFKDMPNTGVSLTLTDLTNQTTWTLEDQVGEFQFDLLLPGQYTLRVLNDDLASDLRGNKALVTVGQGEQEFRNLTLRPGITLEGSILLGTEPLAGQSIEYVQLDGDFEDVVLADEQGRFTLVLPEGLYTIRSEYRENELVNVYQELLDTATFTGELELKLVPTAMVSGRVFYDDNGNGVFDPGQEISYGSSQVTFVSATGAHTVNVPVSGQYDINLPPGRYTAYVVADRPGELEVEPYAALLTLELNRGDRTLDLGLRPAHRVSGQFVEGTSESPVRGGLKVTSSRGEMLIPTLNGAFEMALPTDHYKLDLDKFGYELVDPVEFQLDSYLVDLTIKVRPRNVTLTGDVTYLGNPLVGATLTLRPKTNPAETLTTHTGTGGRYAISLTPDEYVIEVELIEGTTEYLTIDHQEVTLGADRLSFDLETRLRKAVNGQVLHAGIPLTGTLSFTSTSDPQEVYEIAVLAPEGFHDFLPRQSYYVTFDDGSAALHRSVLETVTLDRALNLVLETQEGFQLKGTVVNGVDQNNLEEQVSLELRSANGELRVTTDKQGRFKVDLPPGDYELKVQYPGYQDFEQQLTIDGVVLNDIELVPLPVVVTGQISFTNLQSQKEGLAETPVVLELVHDRDHFYTTLTNATGHYVLEGVLPGQYRLVIDHLQKGEVQFKKTDVETIEAGVTEHTLDLRITPKYKLSGRVFYDRNYNDQVEPNEVLDTAQVDLYTSNGDVLLETLELDENGHYEHFRRSGTYLLVARGESGSGHTLVSTLKVGLFGARDRDLLLERGVDLELTFVSGGRTIPVDRLELSGPVNLTLEVDRGTLKTTVPMGTYLLELDHLDNSGVPDWRYILNRNLTVTPRMDHQAQEIELERHLAHGFEMVPTSELVQSTRLMQPAEFTFNVTNTGFQAEIFDVYVSEAPDNWTVSLEPGDFINLEAGETGELRVIIVPDESITPRVFTRYELNVSWSNSADDEVEDLYQFFRLKVTPEKKLKPNLIIDNFYYSGKQSEGEDIQFTASIINANFDSGIVEQGQVRFMVDEVPLEQDRIMPIFPKGENLDDFVIWWRDATPGAHTIKIVLDPDDVVAETNESDNVFTKGFTIEYNKSSSFFDDNLVYLLVGALAIGLVVIGVMMTQLRQRSSVYARSSRRSGKRK